MPRVAVEDNNRMSLRIASADKALLMRAVALEQTDITDFVIRHAIRAAQHVVDQAERMKLSQRDSAVILALLDNPPAPNARLLAAAESLPALP